MNIDLTPLLAAAPVLAVGITLLGYAKILKQRKEKQLKAARIPVRKSDNH